MAIKKKNFLESLNLNLFNNKSGKKSYNGILIIAGILGFLFLINFAVAGSWISHLGILTPDGSTTGAVLMYAVTPATGALANSIYTNISSVNLTIKEGIINTIVINFSLVGEAPSGTQNGSISIINITFDQSFTVTLLSSNGSIPIANENVTFAPAGGAENFSIITLNGKRYSWLNKSADGLLGNFSNAGVVPNNATFRFNISGAVPGTYNISILLGNSTARNVTSNFTIKINDTTVPDRIVLDSTSTGFSSITPVYAFATTSAVNLSSKSQPVSIYVNISVQDFNETGAGGIVYAGQNILQNATIYVYNETGIINQSNRSNFAAGQNYFAFNVSTYAGGNNLSDGRYMVVVQNISDVGGNTNFTNLRYNITIDGTNPSVTVAKSGTSTAHQIVLDLTLSDATSGINGKQCSVTGGGVDGITMSGATGTQTATQAGLGCNTAYTYTVACTDHAGNTNSQSVTVSSDGCTGGGGTSGSGGSGDVVGSSSSAFWILTYNEATTDLNGDSDGVSSNLLERYRVKIMVDTKLYYVGIVDTTDTTAKINVTTTAQDKEAMFNIGDMKKFDVNADDKYDISVTLNGIDSTTGKADLTLVYVQEPVSAEEQTSVEEQAGTTPTTAKSKAWIWVIVILAVLAILGAIVFGKKKSNHKNYGF